MDWTGETIADRYVVEEKFDAGGMGTVYIARDAGVRGRKVVVKVPHPKLLTPDFRRRFEIEIDQLVALEHPHVVHVYGAGTHNDVPYLAVQYLAGGDLSARIQTGTLSPTEIAPWLRSIASALDHAHRNGCIHRDVKPGNIIFDGEGHAYLSDFGIATVVSSTESNDEGLTRAGTFLGSIPYLPPEAMTRDFAAPYDQYSLALVVYHALSGKMAFEGDTTRAILEAKVTGAAVSLDLRVAGLPPGIVAAVMRAIEVNPHDRFESCTAFADAFEAGARGEMPESVARKASPAAPVAARAVKTPGRAGASPPGASGLNLQLVGLGVAALVLAGLLVWLVLTSPGEEPGETALDPNLPVAGVELEPEPEIAEGEVPAVVEPPTEPPADEAEPPRAFFASRDASLFEAERVDAAVLGLVRAGEQVRGLDTGTGWVQIVAADAGTGWVRLAALAEAPAEPVPVPTRRVALVPAEGAAAAFRIDTGEVPTRGYLSCVSAGGCSAPADGPGCRTSATDGAAPANCITAAQADEFCAWAGKRLPSEGEWLRGAAVPDASGFAGGIAEWTIGPAGSPQVRESPVSGFGATPDAFYPDVGFRCAAG